MEREPTEAEIDDLIDEMDLKLREGRFNDFNRDLKNLNISQTHPFILITYLNQAKLVYNVEENPRKKVPYAPRFFKKLARSSVERGWYEPNMFVGLEIN